MSALAGKRAVVVGYDAISPLGSDLTEQWQNALAGRSGCPQVVIRLGFGEAAPPSPRRSVRDVLIRHETAHPKGAE